MVGTLCLTPEGLSGVEKGDGADIVVAKRRRVGVPTVLRLHNLCFYDDLSLHSLCNDFLQCEYGWAAGYQEIGKEACLHLSSSNGLLLFILYTSCSRDYFALSSKTLMLLPSFSFSFFVLFMYAL